MDRALPQLLADLEGNTATVDALEVRVAIQRYGAAGLGAHCDHLCAMARALHDAGQARPDFTTERDGARLLDGPATLGAELLGKQARS
jgi:hypothetical protein